MEFLPPPSDAKKTLKPMLMAKTVKPKYGFYPRFADTCGPFVVLRECANCGFCADRPFLEFYEKVIFRHDLTIAPPKMEFAAVLSMRL